MERLIQYLISGMYTGSLYVIVALGLVLIYRSTRVLNFAHGDMATIGTYFAFTFLGFNIIFWPSFLLAILLGGIVATGFYFCILIPAQRREATHLGQTILTLGLGLIFQGLILIIWGTQQKPFPFPLSDFKAWNIGGVAISELGLGMVAVGFLGSILLYFIIQKTRLGMAMRATSENLLAAQTLGIPTRRILSFSWALGAILGVVAGIFMAPVFLLDPFFMLDPFFKGFTAAILGGLNSLPGAIVGGIIVGIAESLVGGYIAVAFKNTFAFLLIIFVLLIRPEGLLGKEFKERV